MHRCHPVPRTILLSDARNDDRLESAILRLPRGSALVFRHYHLPPAARRARFEALRRLCKLRGVLILTAGEARGWRSDGRYGAPMSLGRASGLRLATAHSLAEIGVAEAQVAMELARLAGVLPAFLVAPVPFDHGFGLRRY